MSTYMKQHSAPPHRRLGGRSFAYIFLTAVVFFLCSPLPHAGAMPTHPALAGLDIDGLNRACGTAVDTKGDIYISSAGESKIKVFTPDHKELTSIADPNGPCGLAVDGRGNVYVSDGETGNVVKYAPNAYPFTGAPSYGAHTIIDASGQAKGVFTDPTDERLYVAEGDRVSAYNADGTLGEDETQRILVFEATGGSFTLSFKGSETKAIKWDANNQEIAEALEEILGAGNVSVSEGPNKTTRDHLVKFTGSLASSDVEMLAVDTSGLTGGTNKIFTEETIRGFNGRIGEGIVSNATGVAAYTYKVDQVSQKDSNRYLYVAGSSGAAEDKVYIFGGSDYRNLTLRKTVTGSETPAGSFGFGAAGDYLSADGGNESPVTHKCVPVAEQACTAGHFFVYDALHTVVDEFDATGRYVTQIGLTEADPGFADAQPTSIAVDRSGDAHDGTVYVTGGAGIGAELLAYGPLAAPSRPPLSALSRVLEKAGAVATDSFGDVYVGDGHEIYVYNPAGETLTSFEDTAGTEHLAIDATGEVYVVETNKNGSFGEKVSSFIPGVYPPVKGTTYARHEPPVTSLSVFKSKIGITALGIDPVSGHVYVGDYTGEIIELGSATEGWPILNHCFACGVALGEIEGIGVDASNGDVYISAYPDTIDVVESSGNVLAQNTGTGSRKGPFSGGAGTIAVDQSNGHVLVFRNSKGAAEEYDASGAFVTEFGEFTEGIVRPEDIAVDNACSLHDPPLTEETSPTCEEFDRSNGNVYIAFDDSAPSTFDVTAFGPLVYGEPPSAVTVSHVTWQAGGATVEGTVDPRGFELQDCYFEYVSETDFQVSGFTGATQAECVPGLEQIGKGAGAVEVHATINVDRQEHYRYRLVAGNQYGVSKGKTDQFGPPLITPGVLLPVRYEEAILHAMIDPSGFATRYYFEYGETEKYGQDTSVVEISAASDPVNIEVPVIGLTEGTTYHVRLVAENEADTVEGPDQILTTLVRRPAETCPNVEYRTGFSADLPDCRAYELVTPADTRGAAPYAAGPGSAGSEFNDWLVTPRGVDSGESLAYFVDGTLPGFEGTGARDGYRARRAEGQHPEGGWTSNLFSPSYVQAGGGQPEEQSVSSDQHYSFWVVGVEEVFAGSLPDGLYLGTPTGFEPVGRGSLRTDLKAESRFVSAGGTHVIFSSKEQLEPGASPVGTEAIYDRAAGAATSHVISIKPDGSSFGAGENATYMGASEDGSSVVFKVGGVLYVRRNGMTSQVAAGPNTFAGIADDGTRIFYSDSGTQPARLFTCNIEAGPCAGAESHAPIEIAPESVFVDVSSDGSHVFFTSEEVLDQSGDGTPGADNLYAWDGVGITFIAVLDSSDSTSFGGNAFMNLDTWTHAVGVGPGVGRADDPARSTPDGSVFVFQSHAQLTSYDNNGVGEIYRYDPAAVPTERLTCISCDPSGAPASSDAMLEDVGMVLQATVVIPNVTDDGLEVFFQSPDRLVPEDANNSQDVYEWKAKGVGSCTRVGGCLALISSGQGEADSYLYSMSADGHDVFFRTLERLVRSDVVGSPSLYDARVGGGIPEPSEKAACQGDACQGQPSTQPSLSAPASIAGSSGNLANSSNAKPRARAKKALTNEQKLRRALGVCAKRKSSRQRKRCKAQARARYGAKRASKSKIQRAGS